MLVHADGSNEHAQRRGDGMMAGRTRRRWLRVLAAVVTVGVFPTLTPDLYGLDCPHHQGAHGDNADASRPGLHDEASNGDDSRHVSDHSAASATTHHGPPAPASGPAPADHHHAAPGQGTGSGPTPAHDAAPCTCAGQCPVSGGVAPPAASPPIRATPATTPVRTSPREDAAPRPRAPFLLPWPNGPPGS